MCVSVIKHLFEIFFFIISVLHPAFIILNFSHAFVYAWGWTLYIFFYIRNTKCCHTAIWTDLSLYRHRFMMIIFKHLMFSFSNISTRQTSKSKLPFERLIGANASNHIRSIFRTLFKSVNTVFLDYRRTTHIVCGSLMVA